MWDGNPLSPRARPGRGSTIAGFILTETFTPIEKLLTELDSIFAHTTLEQAAAAGFLPAKDKRGEKINYQHSQLGSRSDTAWVCRFLTQTTIETLSGAGEMALWGRPTVADGAPRAGPRERIPMTTFLLRRNENEGWVPAEGGKFSLLFENGAWVVGDDEGDWRWVEIHVTHHSFRSALTAARDTRRRIGEHGRPIAPAALMAFVAANPKYGLPRIRNALAAAGYGVTKERVKNAIKDRDAGKVRLKGGRPRRPPRSG